MQSWIVHSPVCINCSFSVVSGQSAIRRAHTVPLAPTPIFPGDRKGQSTDVGAVLRRTFPTFERLECRVPSFGRTSATRDSRPLRGQKKARYLPKHRFSTPRVGVTGEFPASVSGEFSKPLGDIGRARGLKQEADMNPLRAGEWDEGPE